MEPAGIWPPALHHLIRALLSSTGTSSEIEPEGASSHPVSDEQKEPSRQPHRVDCRCGSSQWQDTPTFMILHWLSQHPLLASGTPHQPTEYSVTWQVPSPAGYRQRWCVRAMKVWICTYTNALGRRTLREVRSCEDGLGAGTAIPHDVR